MNLSSLLSKIDSLENSPRQSIFESIGQGDQYFRTWERDIHPVLCEVAMSPEQIQQLFKGVEAGAGRSTLGKGLDAVKGATDKVSDAWFNKFGGMLQNSTPVQAFDQKYEDIKSKIAAKHPDLAAKLAKYGEFAKEHPNWHKFLLAIAGSVASAVGVAAAGGVGAGALAIGTGVGVATGILNIADRLLQGQKASTAIGRGATTGAIAGVTAGVLSKVGSWLGSMREKSIPFGPEDAGLERISWDAKKTLTAPGMEWTQRTQGFQALVKAEDASAIRAAMNQISTNPGTGGFEELQRLGRMVASKDYIANMQTAVDGAFAAAKNNDSLLQFINTVTQGAAAASGGAASAATASGGQQPKPTAESLSRTQVNELFGITGNKVDAAKLQKAWVKAGSPTDSEEIAKILQAAGVESSVISKAFTDMSLPEPTSTASVAPAKDSAAAPDNAAPVDATAPTDTKPATAEPAATAPAAQQSKVGVGQINKIIPTLRLRDLKSVQKTVDAALAKRTTSTQPTNESVVFYSKFLDKEI